MADLIEITELDLNDSNFGNNSRSSNFGGGLELLMNEKIRETSRPTSDINVQDLEKLENELNDLVEDTTTSSYYPKSDLFNNNKHSVSFNEDPILKLNSFDADNGINLGKATFDTENDNKTWDGYGKFNNIPLNPDKNISFEPKLSKEELLREKFKYLRKLENLEKKGIELSKKYSVESNLQEMISEYETIMDEKQKQNSIKFQGQMLLTFINGIEFLNNKFDWFDIKLDGWSDQVQETMGEYDDIFAELHEKYKDKTYIAPELKLLFQLGGSAVMVHMTNTIFKSAMPGMDDILRQNPDLMRSFQTAAVNSMAQTNPGFTNFLGGLMNESGRAGPPPPMATQGPNAVPPPVGRPGNNNYARPDLNFSRNNFQDGISLSETETFEKTPRRQTNYRQEMKGPSDIDNIVSGLKTKTINIQNPLSTSNFDDNDNSTISINELKELQSDGTMPKRSARRKKSANNTVSLDI